LSMINSSSSERGLDGGPLHRLCTPKPHDGHLPATAIQCSNIEQSGVKGAWGGGPLGRLRTPTPHRSRLPASQHSTPTRCKAAWKKRMSGGALPIVYMCSYLECGGKGCPGHDVLHDKV
jgi:hypothetical protein